MAFLRDCGGKYGHLEIQGGSQGDRVRYPLLRLSGSRMLVEGGLVPSLSVALLVGLVPFPLLLRRQIETYLVALMLRHRHRVFRLARR